MGYTYKQQQSHKIDIKMQIYTAFRAFSHKKYTKQANYVIIIIERNKSKQKKGK